MVGPELRQALHAACRAGRLRAVKCGKPAPKEIRSESGCQALDWRLGNLEGGFGVICENAAVNLLRTGYS